MIPFFGNISLMLALLLTIVQLMLPARLYGKSAIATFGLILTSFLCLVYSHVASDFSVLNVYNNSSTLKPLLYKITGTWGNHEGSMLLLIMILGGYNAAMVNSGRWLVGSKNHSPLTTQYSPTLITAYLTQLILTAGFLSFLIITSNPFEQIFPVPENGLGLNPLLQDIGLAIHPPMLYLGYIGFSVAFSFSIAALIHGKKASGEWAITLRKYVQISWGFLTLGIGLGSWWAYRELGWGGFWFWDPVENVSIMPWLAATGLYHSLIAVERRQIFATWAVLLSIITFCLSLIGIFLVRSGIVSSVHAFATDPSRGVFILGFLSVVSIAAFALFAVRAGKLTNNQTDKTQLAFCSREVMILLNNIFFVTLSATVLLGTLYPIFLEVLTGTRVSVGAPYFNATFSPLAILMLIFTAIAPAINWNNISNKWKASAAKQLLIALIAGLALGTAVFLKHGDALTIIAVIIAGFLFVASIQIAIGINERFYLKRLSMRTYAMILSHAGAAVLLFGIAITSFFGIEKEKIMSVGDRLEFAGYEAVLVGGDLSLGKNYIFRKAHFRIFKDNAEITNLHPEIRVYPIEKSTTLEADIYYSLFSNIYAAVGEIDNEGKKYAARIYYKPMINLIWLGCIMMAIGGVLAVIRKKEL